MNRYLYVENNSINNIDPLGLWCIYFSTPLTIGVERIDIGRPTWIFQFAHASGAEAGEFAGGISLMINCVWALMQEQLEIAYASWLDTEMCYDRKKGFTVITTPNIFVLWTRLVAKKLRQKIIQIQSATWTRLPELECVKRGPGPPRYRR